MNIMTEKKITSQEIARALKMSHDDVVKEDSYVNAIGYLALAYNKYKERGQ